MRLHSQSDGRSADLGALTLGKVGARRAGGVARQRAGLQQMRIVAGAVGLGLWAFASVEGWSAVAYVAALHGGLGRGMAPALCALWVLLSALPCVLCIWAAWPALAQLSFRQPANWGSALALGLLFLASGWSSYGAARITPSAAAAPREDELLRELQSLAELGPSLPPGSGAPLLAPEPVACGLPPAAAAFSLIAIFPAARESDTTVASGSAATGSACLQGASVAAVLADLRSLLTERGRRGQVWLDWVSGVQALSGRHAWIDALKLRPGLDGVCAGQRCVLPGQLLAQGFFSTYRPVPFIPDFQFGVDPARVRALLGAGAGYGLGDLQRIETRSYSIDLDERGARVTPLVRLRRREVAPSHAQIERARAAAQSYVLSALLPDGRFRYTLDPGTGIADTESFNLARQAGAALVLCELGADTAEVRLAIERSLSVFAAHERRASELVLLTGDAAAPTARLGESALPLVSLLFCSGRLGTSPPALPGLSRALLELQRPDGGFWPEIELSTARVVPGPEPLYASGQAVLGLVLLEQRQRDHFDPALPPLELVRAALERAMSYVATSYWSHPLRDFFFLEENWHCLAARAALSVHRHSGYEDFCLRYARFKARLVLEREQGADPDFDGGFGFGNLVPPHNTGAAGLGEALAAALAVERARDRSAPEQRRLLQKVLGFLLRQQWTAENCFVCATPDVIGGMSEHTHSLLTRIDFAQHAWAALGHGAEILGSDLPAQ